jgi:uncharacterized protein YjbI with pentapeptide repeats
MKFVRTGVLVAVLALIVLFIFGYIFNWSWVGVGQYISPPHPQGSDFQREVTLYDWFQLAIIPAALAGGVWWLNHLQQKRDQELVEKRAKAERDAAEQRAKNEQKLATDNQREAALQAYIDKMSELLLNGHLAERGADGQLKPEHKHVRDVARLRTITVLTQLDARRIGYVFAFLREAELMSATKDDNAISLKNADLHAVNWSQADLRGANLNGVNLSGANLSGAIFFSKIWVPRAFGGTIPFPTNLADLRGADLSGAIVTNEQLEAASLKDAIMPDGTKHD